MRKFFALIAATGLFCAQVFAAIDPPDCTDTLKRTRDNFFGVGQLQVASTLFSDNTAISLLGEVGPKSYRGSGTLGAFYDCHRVKVGGEYLGQKLAYHFCSGQEKHWMQQYAVGGRYEYLMPCDWLNGFFIDGSSSFARGKELPSYVVTTVSDLYTVQKQIKGAGYYNIAGGVSISPWECGNFCIGVGYNEIRYEKDLANCHRRTQDGVSLDLEFSQKFCCNFNLDVIAEFRRPYTYTEGLINWSYDTGCGMFSLGVFGGYVWGRDYIPNSSNAGVSMGFSFGPACCSAPGTCYASCCDPVYCPSLDCQDIIDWVNRPAVYMPTVIADPDQNTTVVSLCDTPKLLRSIPSQSGFTQYTVNVSKFFSGKKPIRYSVKLITNNPNIDVTINPNTGVLTITYLGSASYASEVITVTATNSCGSATSNPFTVEASQGP